MTRKRVGAGVLDGAAKTFGHAKRNIPTRPAARIRHSSRSALGNIAVNNVASGPFARLIGRYHESGRPPSRSSPPASSFRPGAQ